MIKPKLKRDWIGRYVKLLYPMRTAGGTEFERGDIMRVTENRGGLNLDSAVQCPLCQRRARAYIKGVSENAVLLLPESYQPPSELVAIRKSGDWREILETLKEARRFTRQLYCDSGKKHNDPARDIWQRCEDAIALFEELSDEVD